ncbi:DUF2187 domain-containing protein [Alteribacter lacisalsi]|jgi:transcription antitermination factor NusG|uniref:DUF2187 domain-containing protein n=1 Tax=Alteribacter lacisalsi TaxID=2045244 RepID=A0A2W0HBM5_9BACI|nr:DUF2187 domain-containing protein [Alteribacter lacisalsi]PYZ98236.1 DUF2187 domain-containing protein [Alteribacter lacisalsi]
MANEEAKQENPITVEAGDQVSVTKGEFKGSKAEVIAVYNNSIAVELDKKLEDGSYARTVLHHTEFK